MSWQRRKPGGMRKNALKWFSPQYCSLSECLRIFATGRFFIPSVARRAMLRLPYGRAVHLIDATEPGPGGAP
jgi:hypothetical protein